MPFELNLGGFHGVKEFQYREFVINFFRSLELVSFVLSSATQLKESP